MNQLPSPFKHRLEKKYLIETRFPHQIENIVKQNPFGFSEVFWQRQINNIYFDNQQLQNYHDNYNGVPNRLKVRLRWYEDFDSVKKPQIEFKVKQGECVSKKIFDAHTFRIDHLPKNLGQLIDDDSSVLLKKASTYPAVLVNSYTRKYFLSSCRKIRLTIDSDVKFAMPKNGKVDVNAFRTLPACIVEIKYDPNHQEIADQVAKHFPFSMTKSSKYVFGIDSCYHGVTQL